MARLRPQYGSVERAWLAVMTEAEKVSELHQEVKNGLMNEDVEKVKNWQKEAYHKQMIGGFKEAKEADEGFKKAQKPWAKKLKEKVSELHQEVKNGLMNEDVEKMEAAKKTYHMACKEEKMAVTREANGKTEASVTPDQQKKLHEKVDKCKHDTQKAKEKYEKSLDELGKCTPQYMESMEQVFDQCQQHEVKRLTFLKEALLDIKRHLNLTENQSNNHGPEMHMNWPAFEEYNPDAANAPPKKKKPDGAPPTPSTDHVAPPGDRSSVSSYDKNQAYSTEWSDDEQPAGYSGNENGGNGNSFEDDSSAGKAAVVGAAAAAVAVAAPAASGVRVRALYDYEGQEQDELTFKAGDELTKTEDEDDQGWCRGRLDTGKEGLYPANYVEPI
ncbi:hypothetical protein CRUP_026244 [Coryphaenoides rupestris]|nr:hypothetical protein CRUP_026244 [Coryphaenoides rupestris]